MLGSSVCVVARPRTHVRLQPPCFRYLGQAAGTPVSTSVSPRGRSHFRRLSSLRVLRPSPAGRYGSRPRSTVRRLDLPPEVAVGVRVDREEVAVGGQVLVANQGAPRQRCLLWRRPLSTTRHYSPRTETPHRRRSWWRTRTVRCRRTPPSRSRCGRCRPTEKRCQST